MNQILNLKGLTESKLLAALDSLEQIDLIEFQKQVFRKAQESYDFSTKGVFMMLLIPMYMAVRIL